MTEMGRFNLDPAFPAGNEVDLADDSIERILCELKKLSQSVPGISALCVKDALDEAFALSRAASATMQNSAEVKPTADHIAKTVRTKFNKNSSKKEGKSKGTVKSKACNVLTGTLLCMALLGVVAISISLADELEFLSPVFDSVLGRSIMSSSYIKALLPFYSELSYGFGYAINRNLRYLSLNLGLPSTEISVDSFSRAGCLIDNPLFDSKSGLDCYGCDSFTHVLTPKKTAGKGPLKEDLILGPQPIVFRNWGRNASLQDLQAVLQKNEDLMDEWGVGINSSLPAISNLKDLRSDDIIQQMEANPHFYFSWSAFMYSSSYLVRKLFPRPLFAPRSMNVQLEKMLYVVGKDTPGFVMQHPLISQWVAWYAQGYGQRKVVLNPPRHCMRKCNSYSLTMHPGDLLSFDSRIWQATSEPSGSTTSMAVLGFFDS